jgi:hypothetical protein
MTSRRRPGAFPYLWGGVRLSRRTPPPNPLGHCAWPVMVVVRRPFLRLIHDRGLGGVGLQQWSGVIR